MPTFNLRVWVKVQILNRFLAFMLYAVHLRNSEVYSKLSIMKPDLSRLLEFEKKDSIGHLIETFSKYLDQVV
jgi:hypothetical protein